MYRLLIEPCVSALTTVINGYISGYDVVSKLNSILTHMKVSFNQPETYNLQVKALAVYQA